MHNEQENIQRKSTRSTRSFQYAEVFSSKSWNCRIPTTNKADRNCNTTLISIEMSVIICLYVLFHVLLPERVPCGVCRWWLSLLEYPCYPAHLLVDHSVSPASSGRLDTSLPPSQSAGGRVLPARRPAGMKWNSAPLPRRRLARRGAGRFRSKEGGRRSVATLARAPSVCFRVRVRYFSRSPALPWPTRAPPPRGWRKNSAPRRRLFAG